MNTDLSAPLTLADPAQAARIAADIRGLVSAETGVEASEIADDTKMISTGILDSFTLLTILSYIDVTLGIEVDPQDITVEDFDSIDSMIAFLSRTA